MLIKHNSEFNKELAILGEAGVTEKPKIENTFYTEMRNGGLGPEEIVSCISEIMNSGAQQSTKLAAARLALSMWMHPGFVPRKEAEQKQQPNISINISGGEVKLQNILTPSNNFTGE